MRVTHYLIGINKVGKVIKGNPETYLKAKGCTCRVLKNGKKAFYLGKHRVKILELDNKALKLLRILFQKDRSK